MEKQSKLNRRGFLKSSVIGATGIVVGQNALGRTTKANIPDEKKT